MAGDQQFLLRQRQTWFVRRKVPTDLRQNIGKSEVVKSLQTRDLAVAQRRRWNALEEIDRWFDSLRGEHQQQDHHRRERFRQTVREAANWRPSDTSWATTADPKGEAIDISLDALEQAGRTHTPEFAALQVALKEHQGRPAQMPEEFKTRFSEAAERYLHEAQRDPDAAMTQQTANQSRAVFRLFEEWSGDAPLERVSRQMATQFLDEISALSPHWGKAARDAELSVHELLDKYAEGRNLSNKTLNRYVSSLAQVWKWAERRGLWSGENPFSYQQRKTASQKKRGWLPLEDDEVLAVLDARPSDPQDTLHWLPLLLTYTGLRLNEACDLDVQDVRQDTEVPYIDITEAKTEAGVRRVPLHHAILQAGFLEHVQGLPKDGKVFPKLKPGGPDNKLSWNVGKRLNRLLSRAGINHERKVAHSFRKSVGTKLERAGVPENEAVELLGHEKLSMSYSVYSAGVGLRRLKEVVDTIEFRGGP